LTGKYAKMGIKEKLLIDIDNFTFQALNVH